MSDACKQINRIVQRAQTDDLYGAAVDPVTGEFLFLMLLRWLFYEFDAVQPLSIRSKCTSVKSCLTLCILSSRNDELRIRTHSVLLRSG